jgi:hypothetical protein
VESTVLQAGASKGKRRLRAYQAVSQATSFARFGVDDATVDSVDRGAVDRFFAAVEAKAAHRAPARR